MDTICNNCGFFESKLDQKIVDCCVLNKLSFYKEHNINIEVAKNIVKIPKFCCSFKRDINWINKSKHAFKADMDLKQIEEDIIKENGFPYSVFIYEGTGIDISYAVSEILKLDHKPTYLHITFTYNHQDDELLSNLSLALEHNKIKYKLVINLDQQLDDFYDSYLAFRLNVQTPFVAVYSRNYKLNPKWTTEISQQIQKELLSFPYACTENNEFLLFPTSILEEYISIDGPKFIEKILETQCPYNLN